MRRLFDRGHLFERRMRQRIVLTAFDFHYNYQVIISGPRHLLRGGGGGGGGPYQLFCPKCGAFFGAVLNQGRDLLEYV